MSSIKINGMPAPEIKALLAIISMDSFDNYKWNYSANTMQEATEKFKIFEANVLKTLNDLDRDGTYIMSFNTQKAGNVTINLMKDLSLVFRPTGSTVQVGNVVVGGQEAIKRVTDLLAAVGSDYKYLNPVGIRRWIRGEVKIGYQEWLNVITATALQNRMKKTKVQNG